MKFIQSIILLASCISSSQNIDFKDLSGLLSLNKIESEKYLYRNGWKLMSELDASKHSSGIIVFTLNSEVVNSCVRIDETLLTCEFNYSSSIVQVELLTKYEGIFYCALQQAKQRNYPMTPVDRTYETLYNAYKAPKYNLELKITDNIATKDNDYVIKIIRR